MAIASPVHPPDGGGVAPQIRAVSLAEQHLPSGLGSAFAWAGRVRRRSQYRIMARSGRYRVRRYVSPLVGPEWGITPHGVDGYTLLY